MKHLRPHRLFNLVKTPNHWARMAKIILPDQDTPSMLDTAILLSLARLVQPRNFFEIGTFLGAQTLNMAANIPTAEKIYTMDLGNADTQGLEQQKEDAVLTVKHLANEKQLSFMGTPYESKIEQIFGNSNTYDFSRFHGKLDMIYIDGGHDLETLTNDTRNSFAMLAPGRPTVVAWHDYANPVYPQVKTYLDELSNSKKIYHIEESWMCFHIQNPPAGILEQLDR
ncbi:MAG: class I SAM-dependent methyltransferase [Verrucomicrobiota bacterium]